MPVFQTILLIAYIIVNILNQDDLAMVIFVCTNKMMLKLYNMYYDSGFMFKNGIGRNLRDENQNI